MIYSIFILFVFYTLACIADGPDVKPILKVKIGSYLHNQADKFYHAHYCKPGDCDNKEVLAWFKKQRPSGCPEYCVMSTCGNCPNQPIVVKQKPADKVKQKFHEGDWIIHQGTDNIYQVVAVIDNQYQLKYGDNYTTQNCADVDRSARLWNVSDAKAGDVLSYRDGQWIFIYKGKVTEDTFKYYALLSEKGFAVNDAAFILLSFCITPATKEQRDTLMKAMVDAGYTFDFEKKELKKIIDEKQIKKNLQDNSFRRMFEQKPAWSEEDEHRFKNLIYLVEHSDEGKATKENFIKFIYKLKYFKKEL